MYRLLFFRAVSAQFAGPASSSSRALTLRPSCPFMALRVAMMALLLRGGSTAMHHGQEDGSGKCALERGDIKVCQEYCTCKEGCQGGVLGRCVVKGVL